MMDSQTESLRWRQIYEARLWQSEDVRIDGVMSPRRLVAGYGEIGIVESIKLKRERGY